MTAEDESPDSSRVRRDTGPAGPASMASWIESRFSLAPGAPRVRALALTGLAACLLLACLNRFVQDDAFISFRYSANLAEGRGLTWNPGEWIEGYTNFLWTVLMAIPIRLGLEPVVSSWVIGIALFAASLAGVYRLGRDLLGRPVHGMLAALLVGTNFTFSSYATGGLETQLQTCCLIWAMRLGFGARLRAAPSDPRTLVAISLLAAGAFLTRMDSALIVAGLFLFLIARPEGPGRGWGERIRRVVPLGLPIAIVAGVWLAWKWSRYGDLVPNTFHTRVSGLHAIKHGIFYIVTFVTSYWLGPVAVLGAGAVLRAGRLPGELTTLLGVLVAWCAYIVWAGGDFMEFRFFVPVLPILGVLITWLILDQVRSPWIALSLAASVLAGSGYHAMFYRWTNEIESITTLVKNLEPDGTNWIGAGRALGRLFHGPGGVKIATSAAGAIPFYSRLDTVDMLGLNDRWVARNGVVRGRRPGHRREATFDYILSQQVNLVIGQPWVEFEHVPYPGGTRLEQIRRFRLPDADPSRLPATASVLEFPIGSGHKLYALYLLPHPEVERVIAERRVVVHPIPRS